MSQYEMYRDMPDKNYQVRLLIGVPEAVAYAWIKAYAEQLSQVDSDFETDTRPVTMDQLIKAALSHQNGEWGEYIVRGGRFEGVRPDPMFWEKLRILLEQPDLTEESFFSCSC